MFITVLTHMANKCDEYADDVQTYHKDIIELRKTMPDLPAPYDALPAPQPPYVHVISPARHWLAGFTYFQLTQLETVNRHEARMYRHFAKEAKHVQTTARHLEHIRALKKYRAEQKLERERELAELFQEIPPENTGSSCTIC